MWRSFFRDGWGDVALLAAPSLLKVLPPRDVERALVLLTKNARDEERKKEALAQRRAALARAQLAILLDPARFREALAAEKAGALSGLQLPPREIGARLLRLYFHQIYGPHATLLELRSAVFAQKDGDLCWSGGSLFVEWDPAFLGALRELYAGYYGSDSARFRRALSPLGLASVEAELWQYFGHARTASVTFDLAELRRTFVGLLTRCRETGAHLHPDFVPLGIYLGCLYEHLATCGGAHDAAAAWRDVQHQASRTDELERAAQSAAL